MNATLKIDTASFNEQLVRLKQANGRAAGSMVRYWSRKMLKKLAWKTMKAARRFPKAGRLRAGWWPAAQAIGVNTVYSGSHGDAGEGSCIDRSSDPVIPSITMTNTVPYGPHVKGLEEALNAGASEVEVQVRAEADSLWRRELVAAGFSP